MKQGESRVYTSEGVLQPHPAKDFGDGGSSDQLILRSDGATFKLTHWKPKDGFSMVVGPLPCDKVLAVESGCIQIRVGDGVCVRAAGEVFWVKAGEEYFVEVLEESRVWCFFAPSTSGGMPTDM